jgi:haloacetate dehalogenase
MARDQIAVMRSLGFEDFSVAGHDRGGRVAYRLALDHADRVDRLALLDIIPTVDVLDRTDVASALTFWPWSLLSQAEPLPERLILGDPASVVDDALARWGSDAASFPAEVRAAYVAALGNPATVHAICEEYRAAVTIDAAIDRADRSTGRRIACPTLALWSKGGGLDRWYQSAGGPLAIWRQWAPQVTGRAIAGGHFFPEQNPEETIAALHGFFSGGIGA